MGEAAVARWILGAAITIGLTFGGGVFAILNDHGQRIAKVETAIIYLKDLVERNTKHDDEFHNALFHENNEKEKR
jgi:hypothetical protein